MKEIQLTQGKIALVDDEDFERLSLVKWTAAKGKKTFYAYRKPPRVKGQVRRNIFLHHDVLGRPPLGFMNDHKDGDGLNNQKANLRFVTNRQNCQNHKNVAETSKYPGVSWHTNSGRWRTCVRIGDKRKQLGLFRNEMAAFLAYQRALEAIGEKVL